MGGMMQGCQEHCLKTSASIDRTLQTVEEAKQSNDPAQTT